MMSPTDVEEAIRLLERTVLIERLETHPWPDGCLAIAVDFPEGFPRVFTSVTHVEDYCLLRLLQRKIAHGCTDASCKLCEVPQ